MRTLLLVDDQESVLRALEFVFAERGLRAVSAKSGALAMGLMGGTPFDAALIDLHMPGMDGLTLCSSLRTTIPALPIWLMTAACTHEVEAKARELGVIGVLRKPFDVDGFVRDVEEHLVGRPETLANSQPGTATSADAA